MNANIEALVKKHWDEADFMDRGHFIDALTEQAEAHAIELRAYEATVANLEGRIRQLEAERVPAQQYTTGHCANKAQPGGCQLHNLHCNYPICDRRPAAPQQQKEGGVMSELNAFVDLEGKIPAKIGDPVALILDKGRPF